MKEISIIGSGLSKMCRFCLSSDVLVLDIFCFLPKMENSVAGVIMKCAAVQIIRSDGMPNFICQTCYTQLESIQHFLMKIEQSDRTLRRYIQQLLASDKPTVAECPAQPSNKPLFHTTNKESLELNDEFEMDLDCKMSEPDNFNQKNKHNEELYLKTEFKVEPIDANLFLTTEWEADPLYDGEASKNKISTECEINSENIWSNTDDKEFSYKDTKPDIDETKVNKAIEVNWKEKTQENNIITNKFMDITVKSEIEYEPIYDNLLIITESVDSTVLASSNDDGNEISSEDTKINIANVIEMFNKCDESNKNIPVNHEKHENANKLKSYQCDLCSKCFSGYSGLYYHKRIHSDDKRHQCDVCNKCFFQSSSLNNHKRTHTGIKPYQCDLCEKCFSQSSNLDKHRRIHTGEKPYQCDFCKKCFSQSSTLNEHKRTHTGEKPYQCDICKKCFTQSFALTSHRRIHTGEKPYQCDFCEKCFSTLAHLSQHKRIHTGEKPYECDICKKCFSQSSHLYKHRFIHTGY